MFVERRVNPTSNTVELWRCQWENHAGAPAKKVYLGKICDEQAVSPEAGGQPRSRRVAGREGRGLLVLRPDLG